jgi:hypothetical protein
MGVVGFETAIGVLKTGGVGSDSRKRAVAVENGWIWLKKWAVAVETWSLLKTGGDSRNVELVENGR